jgi:hypothetical protein
MVAGVRCAGGWQGKTWGATGTATPLTERRKEKINGWLAASHAPSAGRAGSASGRCGLRCGGGSAGPARACGALCPRVVVCWGGFL